MQELVVLVNDRNEVLGTAPKAMIHGAQTPLHRAFSFFGFDAQGRFLIQQRAARKKTWPSVWTNTCCGHPLPNEKTADAVARRLQFELGLKADPILEMLPNYRYQASYLGVMENELCPVFVGRIESESQPNVEEVDAVNWVNWADFIDSLKNAENRTYDHFSVWCKEEALLLDANPEFQKFLNS